MPIDANIPLGVRVPEIASPVAQYAQLMQLQGLQRQNKLADFQMQNTMEDRQRASAMRNALAGAGNDPERIRNAFISSGDIAGLNAFNKSLMETRSAESTIDKNKAELYKNNLDIYSRSLGGLAANPTPESLTSFVDTMKQRNIPLHAPLPSVLNPDSLSQWVRSGAAMSEQGLKAITAFLPKPTDTGGVFTDLNPLSAGYRGTVLEKTVGPGDVMTDTRARDIANMTDARTRSEGAANRGVTVRGQNLVDSRTRDATSIASDPTIQGRLAESRAAGTATGTETAQTAMRLPDVIAKADEATKLIDRMIGDTSVKDGKLVAGKTKPHPGFQSAVGATFAPGLRFIEGSDTGDFVKILNQVKGGAFMQAFETLKGGGSITETEGTKATEALTRMDKAISEKEFVTAARDFQQIIKNGIARAKTKSGRRSTDNATSSAVIDFNSLPD